jgi:nitrate reductase gamma subunit
MEAAVQTVYYIVLVPMVYVAFLVFFVGTIARLVKIFREPKNPTTLQIYPQKEPKWLLALYDTFLLPTVRRHKPVFWVFLMLFHISFLLLLIGHLELFKEFTLFQVIPHEVFLGKGFTGLVLTLCLLFFLFRRFKSPYRELSVPEDYYLLILLFLAVLFGSQMDWARRWYEYGGMTVENYRDYLFSLLYLKPKLPLDLVGSGHSFSQWMHSFFSLPLNKLRRG